MAHKQWPRGHQLIRRILTAFQLDVPNEDEDQFIAKMARTIQTRCGSALMPEPGDSLALSIMRPKTAALAYDKVYRIPILKDPVPPEVAFYGASPGEIAWAAVKLFWFAASEAGIVLPVGPRSTR